MHIRSLAYRTDLALLRAGGSVVSDHDDHVVVRTPDNPTFWWGNFVLIPELPKTRDAIERRLSLFREAFPEADHVAIGVDVVTAEGVPEGALAEHGLEVASDAVLTAAPARPSGAPVPGVTIRPLRGDRDWAEQTALTMTDPGTHDTEVSRTFTLRRLASQRSLVEGGAGVWLGAFVDGALRASLGIFAAGDGLARFQDVSTHPDWRRRGLASALIGAASPSAHELGAHTLVIVADAGSDADRLYRSLGFTAQQDQVSLTRPPAGD